MQENHRNGQEESDIVATSEPYAPLRKQQRLRNCILHKSYQFSLIQCFFKLFSYKAGFIVNVINCTKMYLSVKYLPQALLLSLMAKIRISFV